MKHNLITTNDEAVRYIRSRCGSTDCLPQCWPIENGNCFKCSGTRAVVYHQYRISKQITNLSKN